MNTQTPTPLFLTARGTEQLKPWMVSYTQLALVESCQRKWWFKYVKQLPDPTGAGAAFGSKLHALAEKYITEGADLTDDRIGKLVALAENRGYIPTHSNFLAADGKILIEHKFKALIGHGVDAIPLAGAVDILDVTDPDRLYTGDHKTGKSLRYVKTEEQLRLDQQLSIYLKVMVDEHYNGKPPARLEAAHIVYLSEGPLHVERVGPVSIPWEQVQDTWSGIEKQVPVIRGLAAETSVNRIPGNRARCSDYGGCPFRDVCHATLDSTSYFSTPSTPSTTPASKKEDMSDQNPPNTAGIPNYLQKLQALRNRNATGGMNPGGRTTAPAPATVAAPAPATATKPTLEEYQKNFKVPQKPEAPRTEPPPVIVVGTDALGTILPALERAVETGAARRHEGRSPDARRFTKEEVAEARAQEATPASAGAIEGMSRDAVLYALSKRGFTEQQIERASVETVRTILDEGYGSEDCSILPNGSLKVFKPTEGAVRNIDPVRAEEQDAAEAELAAAAEERRRLKKEQAERELAEQQAAEEAEQKRVAALQAEARRQLAAASAPTTDPRTNGEPFGITHWNGEPVRGNTVTPTDKSRARKRRGSRQLLVDELKLYSLKEYEDMSVEAVEQVMADVERQLREGAGAEGGPPVRRPIFNANTPERKAEIEAQARFDALELKGVPMDGMEAWNNVGVVGFVWRHAEGKLTHYQTLAHFLRDVCATPGGTFALDFGADQANRRKFVQVELDLLPSVLKSVYESLTAEGRGAKFEDPVFEAPPKPTEEQTQTLTTQMGQQVFILVDATAQWALPMEQHLLPAMKQYEKKKGIPYYDMQPFNDGAKFVAGCLMLEEFELEPGNWYSIQGQHPWRQYVLEILSRDPRVRFIYGTR